MSHRNRNENREHKARKDPNRLARRTKVHNPPTRITQAEIHEQDIADAIVDWEDEGGNL